MNSFRKYWEIWWSPTPTVPTTVPALTFSCSWFITLTEISSCRISFLLHVATRQFNTESSARLFLGMGWWCGIAHPSSECQGGWPLESYLPVPPSAVILLITHSLPNVFFGMRQGAEEFITRRGCPSVMLVFIFCHMPVVCTYQTSQSRFIMCNY